ncbi:ureidoglycolate hydrolase [Parahaliea maris]|uniref:Ureidoglycolate hydrolase n=1 Tax=Parahaliea maris TaxID=2716870 RepID=A0A5C9A7F5_9GAMM|nr:ureidoglycolate lyase [Parahaliea maris]TXS95964.1 ureidoglycolate hydrolase [Parahaliea maris]
MSETEHLKIRVETPTAEALKPFGVVLGRDESVAPLPIDLYEGRVKVRRAGKFVSDDKTEMTVCTLQRRPYIAEYMERHTEHTQAFVPLGSKPFVALFAPPNEEALPDLKEIRAFLFDGSAGFMMHRGTWHEFPFAVLDDTDLLVILRSEATEGLKSDNVIGNEAVGPDLEKRDMAARFGVKIELEL